MIVLIGSQKGGTGKTTLALNLAVLRAAAGHDVLLVDADKQGSANSWANTRAAQNHVPAVPCVQKTGAGLAQAVLELQRRYADIIIDTAGRDSPELRSGLVVAQLALFPLQASIFDIETLATLSELVENGRASNPGLIAAAVINRASTNPRVPELQNARVAVGDYPVLDLCESAICDRITYRYSAIDGLAVSEYRPRDAAAIREITSLYDEVFSDAP